MIYRLSNKYFVRALTLDDLSGSYKSWFQDQEVCRFNSHGKFFKTDQWFLDYYNTLNGSDRLVWAICEIEEGHIGNISLSNISFINRNAELSIILGNKKHWGKSVGYDASKTIINHGFLKLNLKKIYLGAASRNQSMVALARKLGMTEEGTRRNHLYLNGAWEDQVEFGLLADEAKNL
jgi:[ribosomal protein S5]-alanine N-acetyltransferase